MRLGVNIVPMHSMIVDIKYFLNQWWVTGPAWRLSITIMLQWHHCQIKASRICPRFFMAQSQYALVQLMLGPEQYQK